MKFAPRHRRVAAWLALLGLMLQIGLTTAHSARHFDHLVGPLHEEALALGGSDLHRSPASPSSGSPAAPDRDHCAIDFCLATTGNGVLSDPGFIPVPLSFAIARLGAASTGITYANRRHPLPPARGPPVIEIIA